MEFETRSKIKITDCWNDYTAIASMTEKRYIAANLPAYIAVASKQYRQIKKIGDSMIFKIGIALLFDDSGNYFDFF